MRNLYIIFTLLFSLSFSETLVVPIEYSTIQSAIDASSNGDEVHVLDDALEFISYCCPLEKPASEIGNGDIILIIGEGQATQQLVNGTWVGSLTELSPGSGYWVKSNGNTTLNFDCEE